MYKKIFIGALLALNCMLLARMYFVKKDSDETSQVASTTLGKNKVLQDRLARLKTNTLLSLKADQIRLPANDSLLKYSYCIFFRINSNSCSLCVSESLRALSRYRGFLKRPVAIITDYPSVSAAKKTFDIKYKVMLVPTLPVDSLVNREKPYFFVLNKSGQMEYVYFPEYDMPDQIEAYFNYIIKKI